MVFIRDLSEKEAQNRLEIYGKNVLSEEKTSPVFALLLNQFKNYMIYVLLTAVVLSIAVGELMNAEVIGAIIIFIVILGFVQEYKATKAMASLKAMLSLFSTVVRDGRESSAPSSDIVPEDLILLKAGDRVPADAVIIDSKDFCVDESTLTGESVPCEKKAVRVLSKLHSAGDESRIFMGTFVVSGKAKAVVTHTGMNTRFGKIAELVETESETIPLEKDIQRLSKYIVFGVLAISIIVFFILWQKEGFIFGKAAVDIALVVIALAVAAIPEGMPLVVTIMLAIGMERMAAKNAVVRKMAAVESLGAVTVICTDKTGTLTKNEMTVKKLFFAGKTFDIEGSGYEKEGAILFEGKSIDKKMKDSVKPLLTAMAICSDAKIRCGEDAGDALDTEIELCNRANAVNPREYKITGAPTEAAILVAASKFGVLKESIESEFPRIDESPFSSERKIMSTLHLCKQTGRTLLVSKGSFEAVLKECSKIFVNSAAKPIGKDDISNLEDVHSQLCKNAMRVIAFASKEIREKKPPKDIETLETGMTFLGMAGIVDPLRPEAKTAVEKCMAAGIKVVMITGDHPDTAEAIGKELGILSKARGASGKASSRFAKSESGIITGVEIDDMTDEELKDCVGDIRICARARPEHKLRIISAFEMAGEVVAMTGDGVNDAPALKKADVGVAMGNTGTDVSRQASDIVLKDDNFATIVDAVEEGRHIFGNIRKFLTYQLSCNFAEVAIIATSVFLGMNLPLIALQILFVNIITDDLPSIALSQNPKSSSLMRSPPRKPQENLISRGLVLMIIITGFAISAGTLASFQFNLWRGIETARTAALVSIILAVQIMIFSFRSLKRPLSRSDVFGNKWLVFAVILSLAATYSIIYVPQLSAIFGTHPLEPTEFVLPVLSAIAVLAVVELYKKYGIKD